MTMIANKCFNCEKTVSCTVTTIENQEYRWHQGHWELPAGVGMSGGVGVPRVYWGLAGTVGTQVLEGV